MKRIASLFAVLQLILLSSPALAQPGVDTYPTLNGSQRTVETQSWIEEWDPVSGQWVMVADSAAADMVSRADLPTAITTYSNETVIAQPHAAKRYAQPVAQTGQANVLAQYGPFVVTANNRAAMMGSTDTASPHYFDAMLRDFPGIAVLDLVEAPGTSNDIANLQVARRIRANGIATHVPNGGSVRSGAVELFLAGADRTMEDGAQFAVHSWLDNHGRQPQDFAADHPANRLYLDFYVEMGMSESQARDFYSMTNSVPHHSALWLNAADMRPWVRSQRTPASRMASAKAPNSASNANPSAAGFFVAQPVEIEQAPLTIPTLALDWERFQIEPAGIAPATPLLDYRDLSGISLAALNLSSLDSRPAFS